MLAGESTSRIVFRGVLIVVAVALALYVIYLLRRPLSWLVIAAFIAIAVSGPVNLLSQHMRRGFAIAIVYLTLILIPIGVGAVIVPSLVSQAEELADNAPEYAQDVTDYVNENETLRSLNEDYDITTKLEDEAATLPDRIPDAAGALRDIGVGFVNSVFAGITILILSIFMVAGGRRWIEAAVSGRLLASAGRRRAPRDPRSRAEGAVGAHAQPHRRRGRQLRRRRAGAGDDRRDHVVHRADDPRGPVRGAAGAARVLLRPDPARRRDPRRGAGRDRDGCSSTSRSR